ARRRTIALYACSPADGKAIIDMVWGTGTLAHIEWPLALRVGGADRVVGRQDRNPYREIIAKSVVPGRSQFPPEACRNAQIWQHLIGVVDIRGFYVTEVIGVRYRHRDRRLVEIAEQKIGERVTA